MSQLTYTTEICSTKLNQNMDAVTLLQLISCCSPVKKNPSKNGKYTGSIFLIFPQGNWEIFAFTNK